VFAGVRRTAVPRTPELRSRTTGTCSSTVSRRVRWAVQSATSRPPRAASCEKPSSDFSVRPCPTGCNRSRNRLLDGAERMLKEGSAGTL